MQSVLEIKNFTKEYSQGKKAVDNLSLSVMPGEIHGFIGHNGAGKTTTIRAVVGVMGFDEGEISIAGHSVKQEPVLQASDRLHSRQPRSVRLCHGNSISDLYGGYVFRWQKGSGRADKKVRGAFRYHGQFGKSGQLLFPWHETETGFNRSFFT